MSLLLTKVEIKNDQVAYQMLKRNNQFEYFSDFKYYIVRYFKCLILKIN